jgi:hypothetical protein
MSREVLLTLLGTLLVINVGVLISIGLLSRRSRAPRTEAAAAVAPQAVTALHEAAEALDQTGAPSAVADVTAHDAPVDSVASGVTATPVVSMPSLTQSPPPIPDDTSVDYAPADRESSAVAVAVSDRELEAEPGRDPGLDATKFAENGHIAVGADEIGMPDGTFTKSLEPISAAMARNGAPLIANGKRRRSRRFVLPPLEEDGDRSARAIEAFLGEASNSAPLAHPERLHRRRHRARRAPEAKATRTPLVVDLVGYRELAVAAGESQAARLAGALAEALWRSARIGDEVRELAPGRIQLVLDCDSVGAHAFAERARSAVAPWLAASAVPLGIEITTLPTASVAEAASSG